MSLAAATACTLEAGPGGRGARSPAPAPAPGCAAHVLARLDDEQVAGQLLMAGLSSEAGAAGVTAMAGLVHDRHLAGVVLTGSGWQGAARVAAASGALQAAGREERLGLWVAGNQEGGRAGVFQAFWGPGFTPIPDALAQGRMDVGDLQQAALGWGGELREAGVNLDLAPVLDTVPEPGAASNQAIGRYAREYGHDPVTVGAHGAAFVRGLSLAGVQSAVKHVPGLGRVPANTDLAAAGISDPRTGPGDPYLEPFRAGLEAGAGFVMVSLARYPRLDPANQAVFSPAILGGLLRGELGFRGVILSDDLGAAAAVAAVPVGARAVRFVAAGGDLVLTVHPGDVAPMESALVTRMRADPGFRARAAGAAEHVLKAKAAAGLLDCGRPAGEGRLLA